MRGSLELPGECDIYDRVKDGPAQVLGSDRNLEVIMNFGRDYEAIKRFHQYYWDHFQGDRFIGEVIFGEMLTQWLDRQYAFMLSEFGCEKFLAVQPSYFEQVRMVGDRVEVTPVGLQALGDQGKRYAQANTRVGEGLMAMYSGLIKGGAGTYAIIVSPTEEYQAFNSTTDIINLFRVTEKAEDGATIIEGKYLVLGRILSKEERRFLHNFAFILSEQDEAASWLSDMGVGQMVATDSLWVQKAGYQDGPEHEWLVKRPNLFSLKNEEFAGRDSLYSLTNYLNRQYRYRFNRGLIPESDLRMYPVIMQLAAVNLEKMVQYLWLNPQKAKYYQELRQRLYLCQQWWAKLCLNSDEEKKLHMKRLMMGQIVTGFEMDVGLNGSPYSQTRGLASEGQNYCDTHDCWYWERCPECHAFYAKKTYQ